MTGFHILATDFQGEVTSLDGGVPAGLGEVLRTAPFPSCPPPSLKAAQNFGGFKIFSCGNYLCVAHFFFAGKADSYGRAVASALILAGPRDGFRGNYRHLGMLRRFLEQVKGEKSPKPLEKLAEFQANGGWQDGVFPHEAITHPAFSQEQLVTILSHLTGGLPMIVAGMDRPMRLALFDLLFLMLPIEWFASRQFCTFADGLFGDLEDVVGVSAKVIAEKKSLFQSIKGLFGQESSAKPAMADAQTGTCSGFPALARGDKWLAFAWDAAFDRNFFPQLDPAKRLALVAGYVANRIWHVPFDPQSLDNSLDVAKAAAAISARAQAELRR